MAEGNAIINALCWTSLNLPSGNCSNLNSLGRQTILMQQMPAGKYQKVHLHSNCTKSFHLDIEPLIAPGIDILQSSFLRFLLQLDRCCSLKGPQLQRVKTKS